MHSHLVMPGPVPGIHGTRHSARRVAWMAGTSQDKPGHDDESIVYVRALADRAKQKRPWRVIPGRPSAEPGMTALGTKCLICAADRRKDRRSNVAAAN